VNNLQQKPEMALGSEGVYQTECGKRVGTWRERLSHLFDPHVGMNIARLKLMEYGKTNNRFGNLM